MRTGCRAAAINHSPDRVRLAGEVNRRAIEEGRLEIKEASAEQVPLGDDVFTCAVMTGVFGFLPEPLAALEEILRMLRPGGRLAVFTGSAALRGTPAAPEPFASRIHFYDDDELVRLAQEAGRIGSNSPSGSDTAGPTLNTFWPKNRGRRVDPAKCVDARKWPAQIDNLALTFRKH